MPCGDSRFQTPDSQNLAHYPYENRVDERQIQGHDDAKDNHHRRGSDRFSSSRKRHFSQLPAYITEELTNRIRKLPEHAHITFAYRWGKRALLTSLVQRPRSATDLLSILAPVLSLTHPLSIQRLAGALGFEPRLSVLETDVLPLTPCPYDGRSPSH